MPRLVQRLNSLAIARSSAAGLLADGAGLYLQVTEVGGKSWVFRYTLHGRRRDMGLGPFPTIGLSEARSAASAARALAKSGRDPIDERQGERDRARLAAAGNLTFDDATEQFIGDHESTWKNEKHRQQWRNTLDEPTREKDREFVRELSSVLGELNVMLKPDRRVGVVRQ